MGMSQPIGDNPDGPNEYRIYPESTEQSKQISDGFQRSVERKYMLYYCSDVMIELMERARNFAKSIECVLVTGESGTGKEMICRYIHKNSPRQNEVFSRINCAGLNELLAESELFGHVQGAFTGATKDRIGLFEFANNGTIMLDEISEMPISIQSKLLRLLENHEFQAVGSNQIRYTNARIIATSNVDLREAINKGTFRKDLYYRLNVLPLRIPPLRERLDELELLIKRFLELVALDNGISQKSFSNDAVKALKSHSWDGNVRELRNVVKSACIRSQSEVIEKSMIEFESNHQGEIPSQFLNNTLEKTEELIIRAVLNSHNNNKTQAAKALGISARTLLNKEKKWKDREGQAQKPSDSKEDDGDEEMGVAMAS